MSGNQAHSGIKQQREELDDVKDTVKKWSGEKWSIDPLIVSAEQRPQPVSSEQKLCGGARVSTVITPRHKRGENCTCGCIRQESTVQHPSFCKFYVFAVVAGIVTAPGGRRLKPVLTLLWWVQRGLVTGSTLSKHTRGGLERQREHWAKIRSVLFQ